MQNEIFPPFHTPHPHHSHPGVYGYREINPYLFLIYVAIFVIVLLFSCQKISEFFVIVVIQPNRYIQHKQAAYGKIPPDSQQFDAETMCQIHVRE